MLIEYDGFKEQRAQIKVIGGGMKQRASEEVGER